MNMIAKLYIGNIAYNACGEDLSTLFAEVGTVLASRIVLDRATGKSRGFGFIEMSNQNEAEQAINRFNGYQLLGRPLLVYLAHDNRELSRRAREAKKQQREMPQLRSPQEPTPATYSQEDNSIYIK
jgi:RNA recognition motif-containing protein